MQFISISRVCVCGFGTEQTQKLYWSGRCALLQSSSPFLSNISIFSFPQKLIKLFSYRYILYNQGLIVIFTSNSQLEISDILLLVQIFYITIFVQEVREMQCASFFSAGTTKYVLNKSGIKKSIIYFTGDLSAIKSRVFQTKYSACLLTIFFIKCLFLYSKLLVTPSIGSHEIFIKKRPPF